MYVGCCRVQYQSNNCDSLKYLEKCSQASRLEYEIHFVTVVLTFRKFQAGLDSEQCLSMSMEKYL